MHQTKTKTTSNHHHHQYRGKHWYYQTVHVMSDYPFPGALKGFPKFTWTDVIHWVLFIFFAKILFPWNNSSSICFRLRICFSTEGTSVCHSLMTLVNQTTFRALHVASHWQWLSTYGNSTGQYRAYSVKITNKPPKITGSGQPLFISHSGNVCQNLGCPSSTCSYSNCDI